MQPVLIHHSCIHAACLPRIHWGNIAACLLVERRSLSSRGTSQLVFHASTGGTPPRNQLLSITAFSTQPVVIHHSCIHATSCYSFQRRIHNSTTLSLAKLKVSLILEAASLGTTSETPNYKIWARRKLAHATLGTTSETPNYKIWARQKLAHAT